MNPIIKMPTTAYDRTVKAKVMASKLVTVENGG